MGQPKIIRSRPGWDGLKAQPLFGSPPKRDGKKPQGVYNSLTQKNPPRMKFASWARRLAQLGITCQVPIYSPAH